MAVRQIVFSNDPSLHEASQRVRRLDEDLEELLDDMIETMHAADGVGLAAVQVGVSERIIVVELPVGAEEEEENDVPVPTEPERHVLINPELVRTSEELVEGIEGCLSIPGWVGEVARHQTVTVEGLDERGELVQIDAEGLLARVFQHEIDHCQGVLFIDRIDDPERIWRVEEGQEEAAEAAQEPPRG